jgi:hypothetical protein
VYAVRGHRPEDRDHHHREPVDGGAVLGLAQLKPQRKRQAEDADRARDRNTVLTEEIRHRLAHARGEKLQDPEDHRDLGHLGEGVVTDLPSQ